MTCLKCFSCLLFNTSFKLIGSIQALEVGNTLSAHRGALHHKRLFKEGGWRWGVLHIASQGGSGHPRQSRSVITCELRPTVIKVTTDPPNPRCCVLWQQCKEEKADQKLFGAHFQKREQKAYVRRRREHYVPSLSEKKCIYTYIIHPIEERRQFENGVKGAASGATMLPPRGNSISFFFPTTG